MEEKCVKCAKTVPWMVLMGNLTLSLFQIYIGYMAKSKGLVADGIHSGTDVVTTVMVIITVALSSHKDDKKYPWGLGKSEFLGAVFAYILLLGISIMILFDAIKVILSGVIHPPHMAAFFAAMVAIIANYILSSYGFCAGKKMNSPALIANAQENRSDMLSSIAVLIGVFAANIGFPILDALAAVLVGLMIGKSAVTLGLQAYKNLIDESLPGEKEKVIEKAVLQYREVKAVNFIHVRRVGQKAWIDMEIIIDPKRTVKEGHAICREIRQALMRRYGQIKDVTISFTCKEVPGVKGIKRELSIAR
ncbi:MAG: cation transporter [Candidatus Omnitrophica bacterium]|nr:cation transporter [Candidatus Omnitrophota bacterium]